MNLDNVKGYTLQVFDKRTKEKVVGTKTKKQSHTFPQEFGSGEYMWKVSGIMGNGKSLASTPKLFTIGGASSAAPFITMLLLALAGVGFWKRREIMDFVQAQKERFNR